MSERNKAAVRGCFENASQGNFDALHAIVSPTFVLHPEGIRGVDGLTEMVKGYRSALAGLTVTIDHQFAEGDYVATRSTVRGRHDGELNGIPPTGREVEFSCLTISRCRGGKIEEEWELADTMSLLRQVGALPEMAEA
jgi:predicted ester cyclase